MLHFEIAEAARAMDAGVSVLGQAVSTCAFPTVSIDSRSISEGEAFFAIKGPRKDGHQFIRQAIEKGAGVVVVSDPIDISTSVRPLHIMKVEDTTLALQKLSQSVRSKWGGKIVAITGSMGKTTTRQFTAELLRSAFRVHETSGNLNNEYGLPLSLLNLEAEHDIAVLELGMSHAGEIRHLAELCQPEFGLITNIAPVHLEFFSDLKEIVEAKAELLELLPTDGHFFFNHDDSELLRVSKRFPGGKTSFGFEKGADVRVTESRVRHIQEMQIKIKGRHFEYAGNSVLIGKPAAYNITASVAVAEFFGIEPEEINGRIKSLCTPEMRGEITAIGEITLWDDTYNASPEAVAALLEILQEISSYSRKIAVLGDMLELGSMSVQFHRQVGRQAAVSRLDLIVSVGQGSTVIIDSAVESGYPKDSTFHFENAEDAASFLAGYLEPGDLVAIKGSRGLRLEKIVKHLQEATA